METTKSDMIQELVKEYLDLRDQIRKDEERLEQAKKARADCEERLAKAMIFRGVRNQKLLDGSTIYLAPEVFLSRKNGVSSETLIAAVQAAGLDDLVSQTCNVKTLTSWAKENWENSKGQINVASDATPEDWDASLPVPLRGLLNLYQRTRVRVRGQPERPEEPALVWE